MKFRRLLGYVLVLCLVISNVFNYTTSAQYRTEFNIVTETIKSGDIEDEVIELTVSHLDIETNEKLEEDEIISKPIGEEIIGKDLKKDIKGYTFEKAEPEKITISEESKEIKLYYKKDEVIPGEKYVDVTIHHYLIDSTEKLIDDEILKDIKVGTSLDTVEYVKEIDGYEFKNAVPEVLDVTEENTVIKLYYDKKEVVPPDEYVDVTILYLDKDNKELLPKQTIEKVKIGEELKGIDYVKEIGGYDFKYSLPEILEVRKDNKEIKLYYDKKEVVPPDEYVDVTINYLLENTTTQIKDSKIIEKVKVGTIINSIDYKEDIEEYTFVSAEPEEIKVSKDDKIINLYYKENDKPVEDEFVDITILYLDNDNKELSPKQTIEKVKLGEELKSRDYIKEIEGYDFKYAFPEILEVRKDNTVIKLYYNEKIVEPPVEDKFVDVTVKYLKENTTTSISETKILKNIKVGTVINGNDHKKDITGYTFVSVNPEKLQVSETNKTINIFYKENDKPVEDEFVDVTINHFKSNTNTKIEKSDILEKIKVGTVLVSADYKKDIKGYTFEKGEVESIEISKENNVINLYYKKIDDSKPVNPGGGEDGKGDGELPETGGRNIIWLGYILILFGIIMKTNKKEEEECVSE